MAGFCFILPSANPRDRANSFIWNNHNFVIFQGNDAIDHLFMIDFESEWRFDLYDYVDRRGRNAIKEWMLEQQKRQRGQVNAKLDQVRKHGTAVSTDVLLQVSGPILKVKGYTKGVQLRPLLCSGPIGEESAFTLLIGAKEVKWSWEPPDAVDKAKERREEVIANPKDKRVTHERIS